MIQVSEQDNPGSNLRLVTGIPTSRKVEMRIGRMVRQLMPPAAIHWKAACNFQIATKCIGEWPRRRKLKDALGSVPRAGAFTDGGAPRASLRERTAEACPQLGLGLEMRPSSSLTRAMIASAFGKPRLKLDLFMPALENIGWVHLYLSSLAEFPL